MGVIGGSGGKKELNFELNLLPVFDILSVCICFLLMTVVWIQVSALKTSQAVGGQSKEETTKPPTLWITVKDNRDIELSVKNMSASGSHEQKISNQNGEVDWRTFEKRLPVLNSNKVLKMALVMPSKNSSYADVIRLMDQVKMNGISDVGLSPL